MDDIVKNRIKTMSQLLPENIRRVYLAYESQALGYGGLTKISQLTGVSVTTLRAGTKELNDGTIETLVKKHSDSSSLIHLRERAPGGGRQVISKKYKDIKEILEKLVAGSPFGSPEQPLLWTTRSLRNLETELQSHGYQISYRTIGKLLSELGYSLQLNQKNLQVGESHPDRVEQFKFINTRAMEFMEQGEPVISIDVPKKEIIGNFIGTGAEYAPKGNLVEVPYHDFPIPENGKAVPYGVYDLKANEGIVDAGIRADTAEFATESIYQWWVQMGRERYPKAKKLFITADRGGSKGSRLRLWKASLQEIANRTGLTISVSHFPPGTSKWNKVEHRMFNRITKNWRGRPLLTMEVIVNLIAATTTQKGLKVKCQSDPDIYERGIKISDKKIAKIKMSREDFHGEWNYSVEPQTDKV